ncbi:mitotic-spindle organizing protein 1 isoform 1-T1 [Dugong dugon]
MASSGAGAAAAAANLNAVRETMDVLLEISRILNTGLDMETLSICVRLCEQGINPEALSSVIKELRKATEALKLCPEPSVVILLSQSLLRYKREKQAERHGNFIQPRKQCQEQSVSFDLRFLL